ncbi:hypothetical protein [Halalkalicoccus sp. NIPERK01]|uniref:hypothetical protein n=1 Tax=Halalkalicoccus sp. NIPERK01 TaxID=3053469 RepID=UPI00256F3298|nr:hypothetical protein [Halalkalicoccus sp. NIPERK01]MDL5361364.1 hypothetical protein [Halalkalicoccus sp. NIPERK01]
MSINDRDRTTDRDEWGRVDTAAHLPRRPDRLAGTVADGVLAIYDPANAFAWIELELPYEGAVFNLKNAR